MRQTAVFSGIPIAEGLFEKHCRAVWFVNIEIGWSVSFVNFENGRAIKQGAIHLESLIPKMGLEPTPVLPHWILSPVRLPLWWYWEHVAVILRVLVFKADTMPPLSCLHCGGTGLGAYLWLGDRQGDNALKVGSLNPPHMARGETNVI